MNTTNEQVQNLVKGIAGAMDFIGDLIVSKGKNAFPILLGSVNDFQNITDNTDAFFELDDIDDTQRAELILIGKKQINTGNEKVDKILKAALAAAIEASALVDTPQNEQDDLPI